MVAICIDLIHRFIINIVLQIYWSLDILNIFLLTSLFME